MHYSIVCLLFAAIRVSTIQLPDLTGRYPVGTVSFELIDYSRNDPFAPSSQPRDLMVSVFYPTSMGAVRSSNYSLTSYFSPKTAAAFSKYLGNSTELLKIATQSHVNATIASNNFPILIFSHGFGGSRFMYTAHLEELASQGWIIVTLDHPYDALITEYPDGRLIPTDPTALDNFPSKMPHFVEVRVADVMFLTNALKNSTVLSQIPDLNSLGGSLRSDKIGIFGHSLGGATAAQAMSNSSTFVCGANWDGGIFGPVANTGLDRPFLQLQVPGHNRTSDDTWTGLWNHSTGFRREFTVNGTVHQSFCDFPLLTDLLPNAIPPGLWPAGTIAGKRLLDIDMAFMDTFFGFCFKGKSGDDLDSLVRIRFPEVYVPAI